MPHPRITFQAVVLVLSLCTGVAFPDRSFGQAEPKKKTETPNSATTSALKSVALVDGKYGHGSGFMIGPKLLVTNSHVVERDLISDIHVRFINIEDADPKPLKVKLVYESSSRDIAILEVDTDKPALTIADKPNYEEGTMIRVLGNPGDVVNRVRSGKVKGMAQWYKETFVELEAITGGGTSGGPVLDTDSGEVVGILAAGQNEVQVVDGVVKLIPTKRSFCIPAPSIRHALKAVQDAKSGDAKSAAAFQADVDKRHLAALAAILINDAQFNNAGHLRRRIALSSQRRNSPFAFAGDNWLDADKELHSIAKKEHEEQFKRISSVVEKARAVSGGSDATKRAMAVLTDLKNTYETMYSLNSRKPYSLPEALPSLIKYEKSHDTAMEKIAKELSLHGILLKDNK